MSDASATCPKCGTARLVKREWAGKNAKCSCGASIVIPLFNDTTATSQSQADLAQTLGRLVQALEGCAAKIDEAAERMNRAAAAESRANQNIFRYIVTGAILLFAVVVIHDIWAKRSYERGVELWTEIDFKEQVNYPSRPTRSHEELRKAYRENFKPDTWLF